MTRRSVTIVRYDLARFARVWDDLPVTPRLVSAFNSRLYPIVKGVRRLSRLRGESLGAAGTDFRVPMGPVNGLLRRTFAGEAGVLINVLGGSREQGFARGVSLIAVLTARIGADRTAGQAGRRTSRSARAHVAQLRPGTGAIATNEPSAA